MELEAENWWLDSTSYDFDDKKSHQKNVFFLSKKFFEKKVREKFGNFIFLVGVPIEKGHFKNFLFQWEPLLKNNKVAEFFQIFFGELF